MEHGDGADGRSDGLRECSVVPVAQLKQNVACDKPAAQIEGEVDSTSAWGVDE